MKRFLLGIILFFVAIFSVANTPIKKTSNEAPKVAILPMKMMILTGTSDYLKKGLEWATTSGAEVAIIQLDTPGGVITNTQEMVQTIYASPIPVVVYVSPSGAMAASAGTFITLAADVAVMAPGTTIGAAHPVNGDGQDIAKDMRKKVENMTVAMMKSIAKRRGRNVEWAEKSIMESSSLTAEEALEKKVIDFIANDLDDLLVKLKGRAIEFNGESKTLGDYTSAERVSYELGFKEEVLNLLAHPNIAALLWLIATTGIMLELYHPGSIFPGVIGAIALMLALAVNQIIPVSSAGVLLIVLGVVLLISEIYVSSAGIMGIGGVVSLVFGAIYLFDPVETPGVAVSPSFAIGLAVVLAIFICYVCSEVYKAFHKKPTTGGDELVGEEGIAIEDFANGIGRIKVAGEIWHCKQDGESPNIEKGDGVQITAKLEGLCLAVTKK
jgi:membrane-bound serine protease (ClpP class)